MVLPSTSKTFVWKSTPAIQTKRLWLIQRHRSNKYGYFYIQCSFILKGMRMYLMLSWGWEQIFLCTVSWWSWIYPRLHPRPARSCTSSLGPGRLWKSQWTEKKTKMPCDTYDLGFTKFRCSTENIYGFKFYLSEKEGGSLWGRVDLREPRSEGASISMEFQFTSWLAVIRRRRLFLLSRDLRLAREDLMLGAPSRVCSCSARLSLGNTDSASVSSWDSGSF